MCVSGVRADKDLVLDSRSSSQGQDNTAGLTWRHAVNTVGNSERAAPGRAQNTWLEHRRAQAAARSRKPVSLHNPCVPPQAAALQQCHFILHRSYASHPQSRARSTTVVQSRTKA